VPSSINLGGFFTGSSVIHGLGWIVYTTAYLLPVMCSQLCLLLGFTMLSSTLRKDVFRIAPCFKASHDKRQIIRFIPAVNFSMVKLCCLIPAHVPTASISDLNYYCGRGVGQVDHLIHIRWITLVKNVSNLGLNEWSCRCSCLPHAFNFGEVTMAEEDIIIGWPLKNSLVP